MAKFEPKNVFAGGPRFEPLSHIPFPPSISTTRTSPSDINIATAHDTIYSLVSSKRWLLDSKQRIDLPTLSLENDNETRPIFTLTDFVIEQDAKAARDVMDSSQDPKTEERLRPTVEQIAELRHEGKMSVPSRNFVDQHHLWEVSSSFYMGKRRKCDRFRDGLGRAIDEVVRERDALVGCEAGERRPGLCGQTSALSLLGAVRVGLLEACRHLWRNLMHFLPGTCMRQLPKYNDGRMDMILREAELLYVNHHMRKTVPGYMYRAEFGGATSHFEAWQWLREDYTAEWCAEYVPESDVIEHRLQEESTAKVQSLHQQVKDSLVARRQEELEVNAEQIRKSPRSALREKRVADAKWASLVEDETIKAFGEQDDPILRAEASRLYDNKVQLELRSHDKEELRTLESQQKGKLRKQHPILSASRLWMERQLSSYRIKVNKKQQIDFETRLMGQLRQEAEKNEMAAGAVPPHELRAKFLQDEAPHITEVLKSKRVPNPPARVQVPRWRRDQGRTHDVVEIPYEQPFWRAKLYAWKFRAHLAGLAFGAFRFLVSGPLSMRALFSSEPFLVNDVGTSEVTPTLASRLRDYFQALRKVRDDFERAPDLSLIGKSVQRFFLRIYLGLKAAIGGAAIASFMVLGTAIMTCLSSATLALSPVLAGAFVLLRGLTDIFIFDFSEPHPRVSPFLNILIGVPYYVIVPGICQAAVALVFLVIHPIVGLARLSWSTLRFVWSSLRDSLTWSIIRPNARIPATDTFLARRIQGPGLASSHLYRMPLRQAFAAVQALLDYSRLRGYVELRRIEVLTPSKKFEGVMQGVVEPFGFRAASGLRPEETYHKIIHKWEKHNRGEKVHSEFSFTPSGPDFGIDEVLWMADNVWVATAHRLRAAHPNYQIPTTITTGRSIATRLKHHDDNASLFLSREEEELDEHMGGNRMFDVLAKKAGFMLSKLVILTNIRERRLLDVCGLPPAARTKFRLPEDEIQMLWRATMSLAQQYADGVRNELSHIAKNSEHSDVLVPVANRIADAFWTDAGSRPGRDIEIVASHILSVVFGGELMLEPLEEVDKQLVLLPKMSEEDEHLDFFGVRDTAAAEYEIIAPKDAILDC